MEKTIQAFKELGTFLGRKLDLIAEAVKSNPQNIRIDMGDATKKMEEVASATSGLLSAMDKFIKDESTSRERTLEVIGAVRDVVRSQMSAIESANSSVVLDKILQAVEEQTKKVEIAGRKEQDLTSHSLLRSIIDSINRIKIETHYTDLSSIDKTNSILERMCEQMKPMEDKSLPLLQSIYKKLSELRLESPSTIKIDEMQMRVISNIGSGFSVGGGVMAARSASVSNLSLTATDTEYSYTFPPNTVSWVIKLREQGVLGYYAFTTGKLPTSGDGLAYATIPQNFLQSQAGVDWSGKSIYLGAEAASQVAEITVYTA